jgi:hypothetical protein
MTRMIPRLVVRPDTVLRCAACHDELGERRWSCEACAAVMHRECARGLGRCSTLGCTTAPAAAPVVAKGGALTWIPRVSGALTFLWPLWFAGVWRLHYLATGPYDMHIMNYHGPTIETLLLFVVAAIAVGPAVGHFTLALNEQRLRGGSGRHHLRVVGGWLTGLISSVVALFVVVMLMSAAK